MAISDELGFAAIVDAGRTAIRWLDGIGAVRLALLEDVISLCVATGIAAERRRCAAEDREKVAAMMLRLSIATGHGDTIDDLLGELEAHIRRRTIPFNPAKDIAEAIERGDAAADPGRRGCGRMGDA